MAYFEWHTDFAVRHAQIDGQHRQLFALAEAIVEPLHSTANHRSGEAELQALIDFAREHFTYEETLMRASAYPEAESHARFHASLLTELDAYCASVRMGSNRNPAGLVAFLWGWLTIHIDSADLPLAAWLAAL